MATGNVHIEFKVVGGKKSYEPDPKLKPKPKPKK